MYEGTLISGLMATVERCNAKDDERAIALRLGIAQTQPEPEYSIYDKVRDEALND